MREWLRVKLDQLEAAEGYVMPTDAPSLTDDLASGKLDANENVFLPKDFIRALSKEAVEEIDPRFYPTSEYHELLNALSRFLGINVDRIALGSGGGSTD